MRVPVIGAGPMGSLHRGMLAKSGVAAPLSEMAKNPASQGLTTDTSPFM